MAFNTSSGQVVCVRTMSAALLLWFLAASSVVESLAASPASATTAAASPTSNSDRLVLVTGGSRGIGKATCLHLASKGYKVALNYCTNEEAANGVVETATSTIDDYEEGTIVPFQADISEPDQVVKLFQDIEDHFQMNPTGLVANAGVMEPMQKDVTQIDNDILLRDFRTNAGGPFYCTKEFVKRASTKHGGNGGSIVCVSSISAESAQILAYGMSKAALEAMVTGLSKTLPLEGIRINTIQPGLIDTGLASPQIMEVMSGIIPARRPGNPNEVAAAIEYLLSDASSYCSGTKLRIAGGL